jgi:uncharacterized membrane protein YgaE (UPF0421/DUF939 family)
MTASTALMLGSVILGFLGTVFIWLVNIIVGGVKQQIKELKETIEKIFDEIKAQDKENSRTYQSIIACKQYHAAHDKELEIMRKNIDDIAEIARGR